MDFPTQLEPPFGMASKSTPSKGAHPTQAAPKPDAKVPSRDAVLTDFRRIAGPLRGRNLDLKPKS